MPDEWCLREFNHVAPELAPVLPETLARMRSLCPVAHSEAHGGFWVVTKYEDVLRVAQDWETFTSTEGLNIPPYRGSVRNIPVEVDPPEQRVYKRMVNAHLTPKAIAHWEEPARALVTQLIDGFIERGECEFMDEFARPFPSVTFFDLALHAPRDEIAQVAEMASVSSVPNHPRAKEGWAGLSAWITNLLKERRGGPPRGDVVDAVLAAEHEGRPLDEAEAVGIVQLLVLGGLETTAGALGLTMLRFTRHPEIPALLRAEPERIPSAVEELLRLDSPFSAIARTATRDVELGGRQVKAGDKVLLYWASANHDADEFTDPDAFDAARSPNRHVAFGAGPHRCLGSNVARLNLRVALEELTRRLDDIKVADDSEIHFHNTLTRAPNSLRIAFRPGPRLGTPAG
ncbi:cytochrome P450 [Frankia sp. CNm7]|uniref:Cytochrome P450 n=2 Tax=Frankia nepalensis TaxID=1836974 RepID=A0A937R6I2_9ACTN|nr:cytochrome P450 [Frankia nepalensis]MBL7513933.1 cytochrome P450 [Frankia nepalensis]MBL7523711.1 cytochrome P450 [Frankia nepalensis]MBL7626628.1 cytochrome P450 [Frankia nepalensis]